MITRFPWAGAATERWGSSASRVSIHLMVERELHFVNTLWLMLIGQHDCLCEHMFDFSASRVSNVCSVDRGGIMLLTITKLALVTYVCWSLLVAPCRRREPSRARVVRRP